MIIEKDMQIIARSSLQFSNSKFKLETITSFSNNNNFLKTQVIFLLKTMFSLLLSELLLLELLLSHVLDNNKTSINLWLQSVVSLRSPKAEMLLGTIKIIPRSQIKAISHLLKEIQSKI